MNKSNKKIQSQQDAEIILQKFKDHKLLTNCKDTGAILLSTKFIFEMEAYLKENYPDLPQCTKCEKEERGKKIIIRPIECEKDNCSGVYHYYCANKKIVENRRKWVAKWVPDQCDICESELPDRKEVYETIRNNQLSNRSAASRKRKRLEESSSESE